MRFWLVTGVVAVGLSLSLVGCSIPEADPVASPSPIQTEVGPAVSLPVDWPKEVPTPDGLTLTGVSELGSGGGGVGFVASFSGPGDVDAIQAALTASFEAAGFQSRTTDQDPPGEMKWLKPEVLSQVTITSADGMVLVEQTALAI